MKKYNTEFAVTFLIAHIIFIPMVIFCIHHKAFGEAILSVIGYVMASSVAVIFSNKK